MKIAILSCFYPYRGGISQFNSYLMTQLGRDNEVRAFNFKRQYPGILFPGKTQFVAEGDDLEAVESTMVLDTVNPITWESTAKAIREWGAELLILRYWMPWFALPLGYVARRMGRGCKVIGILDNVIPHERHIGDKALTKYFLKGLDGCITMCKEVAQDLLRWKPDAKYIVREHPVYCNFGEKLPREEAERILGLKPGRRNLLFFGLIRDYKGLDILIDAFDRIEPNYQLIIAGEPYGSFEKYQRQIDASPGRRRIHVFPKFIANSEVKNYFSAADVTVLPYRSATQSGVSAISYHFDVPMIVTDVGGLKEMIGDTGTGLVSSAATPSFVAKKIEEFFLDPMIKRKCIENIHKLKENLGWEKFCNDLMDFADSLK